VKNKTTSMIVSTGAAVPSRILTNADLEKMVDTSDEWITERSGIKNRYIVCNGEVTSDLCTRASLKALEEAHITPEEIDAIIIGTVTGDVKFLATACYVQQKIGAVNAVAFDISAACSGYIYALSLANYMILGGQFKTILIIGAEVLTSMVDWTDRNTCVLFGDGAGASVIQKSDGERGVITTYMKSDGRLTHLLNTPGGGTKFPINEETVRRKLQFIHMEGREVFKHAVTSMNNSVKMALKQAEMTSEDVDVMIPHQANIRIIEATARKAKIPIEKVFINIDRYGNTSAASIPIALDEARRSGRIKEGDIVLMVVFGGGFTWGSALVRM